MGYQILHKSIIRNGFLAIKLKKIRRHIQMKAVNLPTVLR
jgi:hypothetical protein